LPKLSVVKFTKNGLRANHPICGY